MRTRLGCKNFVLSERNFPRAGMCPWKTVCLFVVHFFQSTERISHVCSASALGCHIERARQHIAL